MKAKLLDEIEELRLGALNEYAVLDTNPEHQYDSIARLAAYICKMPIALISFVDEKRQWFKSAYGIEITETARDVSFCRHTVLNDDVFEVEDALLDERFANSPLVIGDPGMRAYAGAPLVTPDGYRIGSLCVIDTVPHKLDEQQKDALMILAAEIVSHLEADRKNRVAQKTLADYQDFYTMFDTSGELHCMLSDTGMITSINQSVTKVLGYTVEEAIGKGMWEFTFPDDIASAFQQLETGLKSGDKNFDIEARVIAKDKSVKWISWTISVKDRKWFINGRDITYQKQIVADLEQLSLVASKIGNGVVISDGNNQVVWVNQAFEKITGYAIADLQGRPLGDVLKGDQTDEKIIAQAREALKKKQSFNVEMLAYSKDGRELWLSIMNSVILNSAGEVDREIEIITDITAKKKTEEQVNLLSLVASKTKNGVAITDGNGNTTWVNDAFQTLTGYSIEDVKGKRIGDVLIGADTDHKELARARELSSSGKAFNIELLNYRKDGTPIWLSISNTPIFNEDGSIQQEVEIINDISERKTAEHDLIKTREEALQLSRAKEMFLSVMSHEIRTPLNAVIGLTHILLADNPTESQLENLNILKFSTENLHSLLNNILDLTKIETNNLQLEEVDVNIKHLVSHTMNSLQFKTAEKGIALKSELDHRIPETVKGDNTRLYQILVNLLGNSIKFTEKGEVKLKLDLVNENKQEVTIRFEVSDTGIGIAKDKLEYIFEAYAQAEADTTRKYGGTGLGLAITKRLIELHHSNITVNSEPGKGSQFSFTINFKRSKLTQILTDNNTSYRTFSSSVLVVDDNDINRLLAKKVLSKWGIVADFAENGQIALDMVQQKQYDLVLMDIQMPVMGGLEAVKQIRSLEGDHFKNLPIIALTASIMSNDIAEIRSCGMNDYVLKPFVPDQLYAKLNAFL